MTKDKAEATDSKTAAVERKPLKFRVGVPELIVRDGPGVQYAESGKTLTGNDVVDVLNVAGRDAWIEIAPGEWVQFAGTVANLTPAE